MAINSHGLLRNAERLGSVTLALIAAIACGAVPDGEGNAGTESVSSVAQPLVWAISDDLLDFHHAWHNGGRSPTNRGTDFLVFHRNFLGKMAAEYRALGGNPSQIDPWLRVPNVLRTDAHGWNTTRTFCVARDSSGSCTENWMGTLAQASARIESNSPAFSTENAFGEFVEGTIHNWIHGATALEFDEPEVDPIHTSPSSTYFFRIHGMVDYWWSRFRGRKFLHTASSTNTSGSTTTLSHSFINNRPYARLLVTQNWRTSGPYNNHNVGVWYNATSGRWNIYNEDGASMPSGATFNVQIEGGLTVQTAYSQNKASNYMWFFNPISNAAPSARTWATHNFNPPDVTSRDNNSPLGVWYTGSVWSVFNQNTSLAMANNVSFNVAAGTVADTSRDDTAFTHVATASSISGNTTYLSHSSINGNSGARLIVTPNYNPGGSGGTYNNHPIGVWYNTTTLRWGVFNQDFAAMPVNAAFNVIVQR
jgi:hypothetical protein